MPRGQSALILSAERVHCARSGLFIAALFSGWTPPRPSFAQIRALPTENAKIGETEQLLRHLLRAISKLAKWDAKRNFSIVLHYVWYTLMTKRNLRLIIKLYTHTFRILYINQNYMFFCLSKFPARHRKRKFSERVQQ